MKKSRYLAKIILLREKYLIISRNISCYFAKIMSLFREHIQAVYPPLRNLERFFFFVQVYGHNIMHDM